MGRGIRVNTERRWVGPSYTAKNGMIFPCVFANAKCKSSEINF